MDANGLKQLGEIIHDAMVKYAIGNCKWSPDLAGGCAVGAWLLRKEARKKLDINLAFNCNRGHAWNEYEDHIIDITATQYGITDKVFIVPKSNLQTVTNTWHCVMYIPREDYTIARINKTWPTIQQPANYKIEWLDKYRAKVIYKDRCQ